MELMNRIQTGRQASPRRVMVYGVHGIGKSTFGAMAPNPVFIQTEDGLGNLDCARFPLAEAFDDVMAAIMSLYSEAHEFKTVVIDSLDWLERMIWAKVVRDRGPENKTAVGGWRARRRAFIGYQTEKDPTATIRPCRSRTSRTLASPAATPMPSTIGRKSSTAWMRSATNAG